MLNVISHEKDSWKLKVGVVRFSYQMKSVHPHKVAKNIIYEDIYIFIDIFFVTDIIRTSTSISI